MKKVIGVLVLVFVIFFTLPVTLKPVVLSIAKNQLGAIFKDSAVSIRNCRLRPVHLSLYGIDIKRESIYRIKIDEIRISYRPSKLLKGRISRVALKGLTVDIKTPQKKTLELTQYLNLNTTKPPPFLIDNLGLADILLRIKTKDLNLIGNASLEFNLPRQSVVYLSLNIDSLSIEGIQLDKAVLGAVQNGPAGNCYIKRIKYDKIKIADFNGKVSLKDKVFSLDSLSVKLLGGQIRGNLNIALDKQSRYVLNLQASQVSLDTLVNDFNLSERFMMTGKLGGDLALRGQGSNIELLKGNFSATQPGGTLVITDKEFLKYLASSSQQSLDMITDSFKDYRYNTGVIRLSLDRGDLILDANLDGEQGKRNLSVAVHDFNLGNYLIK